MDRSRKERRDRSTRRSVLYACGGVGIAGIAGCLGDDDEPEPTTDDVNGDEADGNGDGESRDPIRLEPSDGWAEPHDGVEVPSEAGQAVLHVGAETMSLTGIASGGELSDGDASVTGADTFEFQGTFQGGSYNGGEITVELSRMLGYEDTSGRWAESDSLTLTRGDGTRLGNVIYRLYEDGRLGNADIAGELDGRRFTQEPFVHVSQDGVVTAVEEFDSHVDDSLNGRLEFGARLPDNWTDA